MSLICLSFFEDSLKYKELISLSLEKQKYKELKVANVTDKYVNTTVFLKNRTFVLRVFNVLL